MRLCSTKDTCRHVEDARTIQGRVFFKDLVQDAEEVQHKMASTQQQKQKWQKLVELKGKSSQLLASEMDEQLREMTALTSKLRRAQSEIDAASHALEECRVDRVKAEQDHCDRFRLSARRCVPVATMQNHGSGEQDDPGSEWLTLCDWVCALQCRRGVCHRASCGSAHGQAERYLATDTSGVQTPDRKNLSHGLSTTVPGRRR